MDKFKYPTDGSYNPDSYEGYEGEHGSDCPPAVGPKWAGIIPGISQAEMGTGGTQSDIDMGKWSFPAPTHGDAQSSEGDSRGSRINQSRDPDGNTGSAQGQVKSDPDSDFTLSSKDDRNEYAPVETGRYS